MTTSTDEDRGRPANAGSGSTVRPSGSLLDNLRQELARHAPFAQMAAADLDYFLSQASQQYFAPDETLVEPAQGEVKQLIYIRRGAVTGTRGLAGQTGGAFAYQAGDLFPLSAALAARAVTATYRATADTFVLLLPVAAMHTLARQSPVFADKRRLQKFLAGYDVHEFCLFLLRLKAPAATPATVRIPPVACPPSASTTTTMKTVVEPPLKKPKPGYSLRTRVTRSSTSSRSSSSSVVEVFHPHFIHVSGLARS